MARSFRMPGKDICPGPLAGEEGIGLSAPE